MAETTFDFDKWSELAKSDPQAFEQERTAAIEDFILQLPEKRQKAMRQLQWKIDAVRSASPNALASCIRIYDMFIEQTYGEGGFLDTLEAFVSSEESPPLTKTAQVIPLPRH